MDIEFVIEIPEEDTIVFDILDTILIYMKFKLISGIVGAINGVNVTFVSTIEIEQIFKNGVKLILNDASGYTLSADKKTATMNVIPSSAFSEVLEFYGHF